MPYKKGFTLIEIIVVLVIIGILAAVAMPNYLNYIHQGAAKAAQNNLIVIYNAQKAYYMINNVYCTTTTGVVAGCGNDLPSLNTNLGSLNQSGATGNLNITDTNFTYSCTSDSGFTCSASSTPIGITLSITKDPIVLTGGSGCADPSGVSCNPECSPNTHAFCPS